MTKRKSRSASPSSEFDEYDKKVLDKPDFHNGGKFNDFIDTIYKMEEAEKNKKREEQIADTKEKLAKIRRKNTAETLLTLKTSGSKRTRSPSVGPAVRTVSGGGKRRSKKRRTQKRRR